MAATERALDNDRVGNAVGDAVEHGQLKEVLRAETKIGDQPREHQHHAKVIGEERAERQAAAGERGFIPHARIIYHRDTARAFSIFDFRFNCPRSQSSNSD
jgi:hypothetical protein